MLLSALGLLAFAACGVALLSTLLLLNRVGGKRATLMRPLLWLGVLAWTVVLLAWLDGLLLSSGWTPVLP